MASLKNLVPNELDELRAFSLSVREVMRLKEVEPFRGGHEYFPQGYCEWASIALAALLQSEWGEWQLVKARAFDDPRGHAWLEKQSVKSGELISIDITLDQFREWDEPFIDYGESPASSVYSVVQYRGPWRDWPILRENIAFWNYVEAVRSYVFGRDLLG